MRIRQSAISSWQRCRRKYTFRYDMELVPLSVGPRRPASGKRDAGSAAHIGVAAINRGHTLQDALEEVTDFVNELRAIRNPDPLPPLTKEDDKEWWEIDRLARAMTENYLDWQSEGNDVGIEFLEVEKEWEVTIPGTDFTIFGTRDAVFYDPLLAGYVIRDNKSVAAFNQSPEDVDFQLRTYAWAFWRETGVVPRRAEHFMMKRVLGDGRAKPPFFERFPIRITEQILKAHESQLFVRLSEIDRHKDMYGGAANASLWPNPTKDCSWDCDYRDVCPMVDDGSDWEYVLQSQFVTPSDVE